MAFVFINQNFWIAPAVMAIFPINVYIAFMAKSEQKRTITLDDGEQANAMFPVIVSASRSTDIPAFYTDWFFYRLRKGYSSWINPFNGKKYHIAYDDAKFIIFWSKNPRPLLKHLNYLNERGIGCYIQFSLNDYEQNGLEQGVPPLAHRIETFKSLVDRLGKGAVIWRFDPLVLTDDISIDVLLSRIRDIGRRLHGYTEKIVFSFADIMPYTKVKANLVRNGISYKDWTIPQMREFAEKLVKLNKAEGWNLQLATCGEAVDLPGIEHNRCVDDRLIVRRCQTPDLLKYLGAEIHGEKDLFGTIPPAAIDIGNGRYAIIRKDNRDKGQREDCGCIRSKDIGQYNTCPHLCEYCYANYSKESARRNHARHEENPYGELITG